MITTGAGLLAWGWWIASGTGRPGEQVPGLVFGVAALIVAIAGALGWVTAGRRAIRQRCSRLVELLGVEAVAAPAIVAIGASPDVVGLPGSRRYHRSDCLLAVGKKVDRLTPEMRDRRVACEMCQP